MSESTSNTNTETSAYRGVEAWHFLRADRRLQWGDDPTPVETGKTYHVNPPLVMCKHGLHASVKAFDALSYAPGPIVCRVVLSDGIQHGSDKCVATERKVLWMYDTTDVLRAFARWCALEVAYLWDMPAIVREYLETGNESIRVAAETAARGGWAAEAAAWAAADAAEWTAADVAWATAEAIIEAIIEATAEGAEDAEDAERLKQNEKLEQMLVEGADTAYTCP